MHRDPHVSCPLALLFIARVSASPTIRLAAAHRDTSPLNFKRKERTKIVTRKTHWKKNPVIMKFLILAILPAVAFCQLGMPGGISDTTVSETYEPVVFAIQSINEKLAATNGGQSPNLGLVEIVKARTQVVNGQNLYLTLHLTGDLYCNVTIWYRAYLQTADRLQMTDGPNCRKGHAHQARDMMAGGVSHAMQLSSAQDKTVMAALNFAACAANDRMNSMYASTLGETSGVTYTQQVTSGMTYKFFNVPMVGTACRNVGCSNLDLTACPAADNGMKMTCTFTVQSQPWMSPPMTLSHIQC